MRRILIDTDPGVDDSMMIQLALRSPEIRVEALTTVFGNDTVEVTTRNALLNLEEAGRPDIPVAKGARKPLVRDLPARSGPGPHGADGLGDARLPAPRSGPIDAPAAVCIVEQILRAPGQITLLAAGPLTNLALALSLQPEIARLVPEVVVMGGVVQPGRADPLAEFNIRSDPEAARLVLHAGWPLTVVGLDVTTRTDLTQEHLDQINRAEGRVGQFLGKIVPAYVDWCRRRYPGGAVPVHDVVALGYLLDPSLFETESLYVDVEVRGELTAGQTLADFRGTTGRPPNARVCRGVDSQRLVRLFVERVTS